MIFEIKYLILTKEHAEEMKGLAQNQKDNTICKLYQYDIKGRKETTA